MRGAWAAFRPSAAYVAALAAFALHQFAQRGLGWSVPLLDAYLDPFLSIPLALGLAGAERRFLHARLPGQTVHDWPGFRVVEVVAMTAALAVVFEYVFPAFDPERQTYDPWDFAAYGLGAVAYGWFARR